MTGIDRRTVLLSTALVSLGLAWSWPSLAADALDEHARLTLVRMARLLYPHDALAEKVYAEIVGAIIADPSARESLKAGVEALDAARGRPWLELGADEEIAALQEIEASAFFALMQAGVRGRLYERPEVWKLIGYGGPSAQSGGYKNRGFDDIGWLPEGE